MLDGKLATASVTLNADRLPYNPPDNSLDLSLSASAITLDYTGGRLRVGCDGRPADVACVVIHVVDGVYKRNIELHPGDHPAAAPPAVAATSYWDNPGLAQAQLNLFVDVAKFSVKDNIANPIDLHGNIHVTGTASQPQLDGGVAVDRGSFRIPGTRAQFTRTSGAVTFSANQPADDPALKLTSEADFRDLNGQDHVITLTIDGTLQKISWDLKTSTGYDRGQTLTLLVLGRNLDQLRRSLGDQSIGANPTVVDPSTNPSASAADQVVKDLAGDAVTGLLGSSVTKLVKLDVLRFELGFGAIGVHIEKKFLRNLNFLGDAELTSLGYSLKPALVLSTPWLKLQTNNHLELHGSYLTKQFNDPADATLDVSDLQGSVVYKFFIP